MIVFEYMYGMMVVFEPLMDELAVKELEESEQSDVINKPEPEFKSVARALILSLSVCYHARLQDREKYENGVVDLFPDCISLPGGPQQFRDEIRWCQEVLLDHMQLGDNIAKNAALRENVFMMAICVELRIPLFLVGKPGSSKSLAKSIISDSMKGRNSANDLLKKFKEIGIFSYQCSQLSTPESVIEVFNNASKFQRMDRSSYVAVVVLDEVGLAEDSPNLPLKALHPLLEDGTEGAKHDFTDEIIAREERVAFIGISNWALDPAKVNRGVMVTRGDPSEEELVFSAMGICSNKENDPIRSKLESFFEPLAKAYANICAKQPREFYGLRDFYSLIKMLYYMCEKTELPPTWPQLEHVIRRNFGGLESDTWNPYVEFTKQIQMSREPPDLSNIARKLHSLINPDCSRLGLIRTCLSSQDKTWHGENRYVLFLTENYAALDVLKNPKNYLSGEMSIVTPVLSEEQSVKSKEESSKTTEPFILFGSSFPKDKEYTQVCQNINQIKICMETGRTVILLNLGNLYESLYDALNQYYINHAGNRYVDLGLQSHRVKCRVDKNFRLILIAEKDTVYEKFPTPLINRLEKHFVLTSSILEEWQQKVLATFEDWISRFCNAENSKFKKHDAFIGYQKDTPASVVFQATNLFRLACAAYRDGDYNKKGKWADIFKRSQMKPEDSCIEGSEQQSLWEDAVVRLSKHLLLQVATPEAIVRLKHCDLASNKSEIEYIHNCYFHKSRHSLDAFLSHHVNHSHIDTGALMQVTTHSHLLSQEELKHIEKAININITSYFLSEFDTELDFKNKVGRALDACDVMQSLVIIQCDSGHGTGDLIACARYRVYDLKAKATKKLNSHILFLIHLPRNVTNSSFVCFQGDPWVSFHIDDLRPTDDIAISVGEAIGMTISELFRGNASGVTSSRHEESGDELDNSEGSTDSQGEISPAEPAERNHSSVQHAQIETARYRRLHGCIQAAASKLKDSTKRSTERLTLLVRLIPKVYPGQYESTQFCEVLVQHIQNVLQEHDEVREDQKDWVSNEAMNAKSLQHGGTFRNVLSRKVDEVVVPLFSQMIASIDRNYNLSLIAPKNESSPLSQLWLSMFRNSSIMQFNYRGMVTSKQQVSGLGEGKTGEDFRSQFPFSWLMYDAVERQWDNAKSSAGNEKMQLYKQLCVSIQSTCVYDVLKKVEIGNYAKFFDKYLHDFVRLVHKCNQRDKCHQNKEYRLIFNALDAMVIGEEFGCVNEEMDLLQRIAALHVLYHKNRAQILWFGQLVGHSPGIMVHMTEDMIHSQHEMILHAHAAEIALKNLAKPLYDIPEESLIPWLNEVHTCQNAITSILSLPSENAIQEQSRQRWGAIRVLQLFLEHVLLKHEFANRVSYLDRLITSLDSSEFQADFLKVSTLRMVQSHLEITEKEVKKKRLVAKHDAKDFTRHCRSYFMEVVSTLCFGGQSAPEPDVIKMLMNMMFAERQSMISTSAEKKTDVVPVITSSLLQLLLEHNSETVKAYLEEFYRHSRKALVGHGSESLCLLCIQCFEDALFKEHASEDTESRLRACSEILKDAHFTLTSYKSNPVISIGYLEAVAGAKFAITEVANFIHSQLIDEVVTRHSENVSALMERAREICSDTIVNITTVYSKSVDVTGPVVYLLKLLVRQFSFPCLKQASERYPWIVPEGLRTSNLEKVMDPFVIYDNTTGYSTLREKIEDILHHGKRLDKLLSLTKDYDVDKLATLLLAMYETITMVCSHPKRLVETNLLDAFDDFLVHLTHLKPSMLRLARLFLHNSQGSPLPQMRVRSGLSPECKILGAIVVHTATVLSSNAEQPFLLPFVNMFSNPAALANAYLPTMVDDNFFDGHRYAVGGCGRPLEKRSCNVFGAKIGGDLELRADNTDAENRDTTQTGHILGGAKLRTNIPAPERDLPPPAMCIFRAIMHSAFLMCACHNPDKLPKLANLVKPSLSKPQLLPEFFWMHLRKDLEHLSRSTGEGMEESSMIVHLVLQDMSNQVDCEQFELGDIKAVNLLDSKEARRKWEGEFDRFYIRPVISRLDARLDEARELLAKDDTQGQDELFHIVYEKKRVKRKGLDTHLWSYRQRISLEHLGQTLQNVTLKEQFPILHEFLRVESTLRATQYLPDIVKLQRSLYDIFHHRLDRKEAETETFGGFLRTQMSSNMSLEYQARLQSVNLAWRLVGQNLKTHGRYILEEKHCLAAITKDVPLEYLIPTTSGAGVLTTSLVDYLIQTHNAFINRCYSIVEERGDLCDWFRQKVPITHIHRCHLLDYEHQIVSVVLSHCRYSLKLGEAHTVHYDHQALEKHILDTFVYGKPEIECEEPLQVKYRKDIYTTDTFEQVRKKVSPQVRLGQETRKEIISELRTPDRLRENLDVVDIVLGFLSSGGGKPDKPLGEYIKKVLKMKKPFSQKAREYCRLEHILSLWEILSVELSRQTWLQEQEPFDSLDGKCLRALCTDPGNNQEVALDRCLRSFNLDRLLGALFEFIETYVRNVEENHLELQLKDIITKDQFEHLGIEENFREDFPESITLDQTVAVWKHIVRYQKS